MKYKNSNFEFTIGNKKIAKDTMIINMGSATNCPSRLLGLCKIPANKCYALKAEKQYPACKPYRDRQAIYWNKTHADTIVDDIRPILNRKRKTKIKYIRFNEAGDFSTTFDINKLSYIAECLPDIIIYTYTHRIDLINDKTAKLLMIPKNLVISISNTKIEGFNQFKAVKELPKNKLSCIGDCSKCKLCKTKHNKTVHVEIH